MVRPGSSPLPQQMALPGSPVGVGGVTCRVVDYSLFSSSLPPLSLPPSLKKTHLEVRPGRGPQLEPVLPAALRSGSWSPLHSAAVPGTEHGLDGCFVNAAQQSQGLNAGTESVFCGMETALGAEGRGWPAVGEVRAVCVINQGRGIDLVGWAPLRPWERGSEPPLGIGNCRPSSVLRFRGLQRPAQVFSVPPSLSAFSNHSCVHWFS
ncbi:hypothetical protein HJG60_009580 [Phyllostomus discolor]|uniref:Uncharacterized protein n=1 Tax=Phyllostomus discolor TaxID=89673 RepID=A0A833YI20_9CHIR|nr:hypothetical protein HJG60_009580 [Phyllostomus discolor]